MMTPQSSHDTIYNRPNNMFNKDALNIDQGETN